MRSSVRPNDPRPRRFPARRPARGAADAATTDTTAIDTATRALRRPSPTLPALPPLIGALLLALLAACAGPARRPGASSAGSGATAPASGPHAEIYVVRRRWHTDIGFAAQDLQPPLASVRAALPRARYLLFGFGDRHYLLSRGRSFGELLGALWPGPGVMLVTGLVASPAAAFGPSDVTRLTVGAAQERDLEHFVWRSLALRPGAAAPLAPGPYTGSLYYASAQRYSAFHTCNTWTAEALDAAHLPVSSTGVEFAGQVWAQVRRLAGRRPASYAGP